MNFITLSETYTISINVKLLFSGFTRFFRAWQKLSISNLLGSGEFLKFPIFSISYLRRKTLEIGR